MGTWGKNMLRLAALCNQPFRRLSDLNAAGKQIVTCVIIDECHGGHVTMTNCCLTDDLSGLQDVSWRLFCSGLE